MRNRDIHKKLRQAFDHAAPQTSGVTPPIARAAVVRDEAPKAARPILPRWALVSAAAVVVLFCVFVGAQLNRGSLGPTQVATDGASATATGEPSPVAQESASALAPEESTTPEPAPAEAPSAEKTGRLLLVGEWRRGNKLYLDRELALWQECYQQGMRDLFVELEYAFGGYLNLWMQSDSDDYFEQFWQDYVNKWGFDSFLLRDFYRAIKATCPETVFHAVDVGWYSNAGWRYIHLLEAQGKQDTPEYARARENLKQGRTFNGIRNNNERNQYWETCIAENVAEAFESLGGRDAMGIFDIARINGGEKPFPEYETVLEYLLARYPDAIEVKEYPPVMDTVIIGDREYAAEYGGAFEPTSEKVLLYHVWRIEGGYETFKDAPLTGDSFYCYWLLFPVETGRVYVLRFDLADGSEEYVYYRTDGDERNGYPIAVEFIP